MRSRPLTWASGRRRRSWACPLPRPRLPGRRDRGGPGAATRCSTCGPRPTTPSTTSRRPEAGHLRPAVRCRCQVLGTTRKKGTAMTTHTGLRSHAVVDSPIGPLTLVADDGRLSGPYMEVRGHEPEPASLGVPGAIEDDPMLVAAARQLDAYFAGELTSFDLPLGLEGTSFQQTVWARLQDIPYGETTSYGELARRIGQPTASRAVGLANGRNPVSIMV